MKYWSIACKQELILMGQNPDRLNRKFKVLNAIGVIFNVLAAQGNSYIGNPDKPVMLKVIYGG